MMKKILSIILSVCMLMSMVIIPVAVQAESTQEVSAYEASTLGSYYKFTFEEGESYNNYNVWFKNAADQGKKESEYQTTWKGNTFYPVVAPGGYHYHTFNVSQKEITVKGGKTYNVLEVNNQNDVALTPLTAAGQPYELMPGKSYKVRVKMFVPREDVWNSSYFSLGNNERINSSYSAGNITNTITGSSQSASRPYSSGNLSTIAGDHYACNFADGTYNEDTTFGSCLATHTGCTHNSRSNKVYVDKTVTISVPAAGEGGVFTYDATNNSYSATLTDAANASKTYKMNNYLTMYLGGGNANGYATNASYGFYGSEGVDTTVAAPNTFQIISIEVYEEGVGSANLHVGDEVITLKGNAGEAIDTSSVVVPEDYVISGWYTDAQFENAADAELVFAEGAPVDFYAKLRLDVPYEESNLGDYYEFTFEEGKSYNNYQPWFTNSIDAGVPESDYKVSWKGNSFYPLWSTGARYNTITAAQKEITVKGGNTYNVLEITTSSEAILTPLTASGQPYELIPGKSYKVRVKMFVPREDCWNSSYFSLGNNDTIRTGYAAGNITNAITGKSESATRPYSSGNLSTIAGDNYACNFADGTYNEDTTFGSCLATHTGCTHTGNHNDRTNKVYVDKTVTISVPAAGEGGVFTYDATNNSYSATLTDAADASKTYKMNNYLTMYLGGGNANGKVADATYGFYGSEGVDTSVAAYNTYQIISIEVYEEGVGTANIYKDGEKVATVKGTAGEEIDTSAVAVPEGYVIAGWYADADFTQKVETPLLFTEGAPVDLYVKIIEAGNFGDCNDDGEITTTDLAALKLYLAGAGEVGAGGDCNGDGEITTTDLAALKLYLAGAGVLGPQE